MKTRLFLLFACVMCSLTSFSQTNGTCGENLTWTFDESTGTLTISGEGAMTGYASSSSVPWSSQQARIKTLVISNGVTSIGHKAVSDCSGLTGVTIPSSVTNIGDYAFQNCQGLTSITIPNSVTSIGFYTFWDCSGLTGILTIPESVTSIGHGAFCNCSELISITIPTSVTSIGHFAFSDCYGLTSITIPNSDTSIGNLAFAYCYGLTSMTIPNSVTSIGNLAFAYCTSLEEVTVEWQMPLEIPEYVFEEVDVSKVKLIIPAGTASKYRAANGWKNFQIEESNAIEPVIIATDDSPVIATQYYDLQGRAVAYPQKGHIYIVKELRQSGKMSVKKVIGNNNG